MAIMVATTLIRPLCLRHPIETVLEIYRSHPSHFQKWNWWNIHWGKVKSLYQTFSPCWTSPEPLLMLPFTNPGQLIFYRLWLLYILHPLFNFEHFPMAGCWEILLALSQHLGLLIVAAGAWWPSKVSSYWTQDSVIVQERTFIYIYQLQFNFQDLNPFGCWEILLALSQNLVLFPLLLLGKLQRSPAIEPRTLLLYRKGLLYIFQLLFNFQDLNPIGCWEFLLACHTIWCCSSPLLFLEN